MTNLIAGKVSAGGAGCPCNDAWKREIALRRER